MLARQWQFDELRGEDAGSPVLATVTGEHAAFGRFHAGPPGADPVAEAVDLAPPGTGASVPVEAWVEAELPAVLPLRLRTQTGLHLVRRLRAAGLAAVAAAAATAFPIELGPSPDAAADGEDPVGEARTRLAAGRVPDGAAVLAALEPLDDGAGGLTGIPGALAGAAGGNADAVRDVLATWRAWAGSLLAAPSGTSWNPNRLEHAFLAQARLSDGPVTMTVEEYTGGTLDWFHGDLTAGPDLGAFTPVPGPDVDPRVPVPIKDTTLPTPVRFAGMPSDRLFAFEDAKVYLGGLQAGRTDLARLAVVEFALGYSVDWFQVPLVLPYGARRADRRRARRRHVRGAGHGRSGAGSDVAGLDGVPVDAGDRHASRLADVFVLAATVPRVLEGLPLEEVALFRDEMANLVWGVERVVPGRRSGEPVPRATQAARVSLVQPDPPDRGDAAIVYRLMTPVPENWLPFVAVRERPADLTAHHLLERRPMLRYRQDGAPELVNPRGTVLLTSSDADPATDRLRIAEEEVPRDGVVVTRAFQQARTEDGGTVLWIGRRVRTGRGEGASGLRFDTALPPGAV